MKDYDIFLDSSADIDAAYASEHGIRFVPMCYTVGDEERTCSCLEPELLLKRFYDGQREGDVTHTSQVTPQQYIDAFSPTLDIGRDILYLSLSGGLTNSSDSIHIAGMELADQYPDSIICAVDTLSATVGIGLLAMHAVKNREAGMTLEENASELEAFRHRVCHLFMVEDLMYLKRGGRISSAAAVIGTALGIKPILTVDKEGTLVVVDKKRGRKAAMEEILARCLASRDSISHIYGIVHSDAAESAQQLKELIKETDTEAEFFVRMLTPIIGAHTGPGMLGLVFFGDRAGLK